MKSEQWLTMGVVTVLAIVGALSWSIHLRPPLQVDAESLGGIPLELRHWKGRDIPMQGSVEKMLDADFHVQRSYVHRTGFMLWLYVGYYGTERGGRPEHTPWMCYPSNGWEIVARDVVKVDADKRANEIIVEKGGERRLVHFWYQSYRKKQVVGGIDQIYERLAGRILEGRADGSLVRLSTPLPENLDVGFVRSRLIAFGRDVAPLLHDHWPEEFVDPAS